MLLCVCFIVCVCARARVCVCVYVFVDTINNSAFDHQYCIFNEINLHYRHLATETRAQIAKPRSTSSLARRGGFG